MQGLISTTLPHSEYRITFNNLQKIRFETKTVLNISKIFKYIIEINPVLEISYKSCFWTSDSHYSCLCNFDLLSLCFLLRMYTATFICSAYQFWVLFLHWNFCNLKLNIILFIYKYRLLACMFLKKKRNEETPFWVSINWRLFPFDNKQ